MTPPRVPETPPQARARERSLGNTWPLFSEAAGPQFPEDGKLAVTPYRPDTGELEALEQRIDVPETSDQAESELRDLRESQPPVAPEWQRAARAMVAWLSQRIEAAELTPADEDKVARTWAAFSLGAVSDPQILRVAHVVSRAHSAIRETPRGEGELQAALLDCGRVLHAGLPTPIRSRMPLERAVRVVRNLRGEADAWAGVVEGTCELLGWRDYARIHAASIIRRVIEQGHRP